MISILYRYIAQPRVSIAIVQDDLEHAPEALCVQKKKEKHDVGTGVSEPTAKPYADLSGINTQ